MPQWQEWSLTIKWEMFCEGESLREKVPRCQGLGWCSLRPLASAGAEVSSGRAAKYEEWRVCETVRRAAASAAPVGWREEF